MGLNPFELPLPEIDAVMERALAVGRSCGVAVGAGSGTPEELKALAAQGFTFLSYGPDYKLLVDAIRPGVEAFPAGGKCLNRRGKTIPAGDKCIVRQGKTYLN